MRCPHCSAPGVSLQDGVCYACGQEVLASEVEASPPQQGQNLGTSGTGSGGRATLPEQRPYLRWLLLLLAAVVVLGGYALVALLLGVPFNNPAALASSIGGGVALMILPMLFWYSSTARRMSRRMLAGDYLVRWPYSEQEWLDFAKRSWKRAKILDGVVCIVLFVVVLGIWSGAAGLNQPGSSVAGLAFGVVGIVSVVVLAIFLFNGDSRLYRQRLLGSGEVLVSRNAILGPEGFILLTGLKSVVLEDAKTVIKFTCVNTETDIQTGGRTTVYSTHKVMVPLGYQAEAEQLVQQFEHELQGR